MDIKHIIEKLKKSSYTKNFKESKITDYIKKESIVLYKTDTIEAIQNLLCNKNICDQITYFYVVDDEKKLCGIVPLRRLITTEKTTTVEKIMISNIISLSHTSTIEEAQNLFMEYKFLAFPVIDEEKKLLGIFDITVLTSNDLNFQVNQRFDEAFELIGVRASIIQYLTPWSSFLMRFPWLIPTIIGGTFCAILSSYFEHTIAGSIILTFFLTMILGLGESVSIQSLSITLKRLQIQKITLPWYCKSIFKELITALLLGTGIGLILFTIVMIWKQEPWQGISIGISVVLSLCSASFFGITIPTLIHHTKLDPKVAAGPLVLGFSDICTVLFYFGTASILL
ncbi:MAG TPA: magnesium transporter [Planctomycetota bacterium]|nr:magnesium transporter [Planctomycetota bacterium]HRU52802.1 magnesium transporter [Planctomycetota bacterium]